MMKNIKQEPKLYEDGVGIEVYIAHNIREARKYCMDEYGWAEDETKDIDRFIAFEKEMWWMLQEIKELDNIVSKFGEVKVSHFGGELAVLLTYAQVLKIYAGDIPCLLSSTEW